MIDGMGLVGVWLRQLLRAGTAAAIVPVAMLAALVVVLVGGGLGGLGSLGQLVSGPEISPAERVADAAAAGGELADVPAPAALARVSSAPSGAGASKRSTGARVFAGRDDRTRLLPLPPPPPRPPPTPPPGVTPSAPAVPAAAPPRRPTLDHGARKLVDEVNEAVGEVGTLVREVIIVLQQTVQLLTGPPLPLP